MRHYCATSILVATFTFHIRILTSPSNFLWRKASMCNRIGRSPQSLILICSCFLHRPLAFTISARTYQIEDLETPLQMCTCEMSIQQRWRSIHRCTNRSKVYQSLWCSRCVTVHLSDIVQVRLGIFRHGCDYVKEF